MPLGRGVGPRRAGAPPVSTASTAMSPSTSTPLARPWTARPSAKVTSVVRSRRLWALVTTSPSATTTPQPRPPWRPMRTTDGADGVGDAADGVLLFVRSWWSSRSTARDSHLQSASDCIALGMPSPQGLSRPAPGAAADDPGDQGPTAAAVGDRWSLLVVGRLLAGPRRFGELLDDIDGLAPNILARRLARLEAEGWWSASPTRPGRSATPTASRPRARPCRRAADARRLGRPAPRRARRPRPGPPRPCGTALEARWFCPTCDTVVDVAARPTDRRATRRHLSPAARATPVQALRSLRRPHGGAWPREQLSGR